jgi:SAM-dependent methyltransferase
MMPGASVLREADATLAALLDLGVDLTLVHYWPGGYFPVEHLRGRRVRYVTLADAGFPGFPRLPRRDYERACGADFDPIAINLHEFVREAYPTQRGYIHIDSWHYQQYFGAAYRIGMFLETVRPDLAIVQGGSDAIQKLARMKCGALGIPVLGWETPFLPDRLLLDSVGMHFFPGENAIDRDWPITRERPLSDAQAAHLASSLAAWRERRASKYPQASDAAELRALDDLARAGRRIVFMPGQIPWDANILTGPHGVSAYDCYVDGVRHSIPEGWALVYKAHPLDPRPDPLGAPASDRFLPVRALSIHDLFARADAVLVHSSNVGLEALMSGRPVVCLGTPHYAHKGLTLDVNNLGELGRLLGRAVDFTPSPDTLDRFLHYLIADYLIPVADTARLGARLGEARESWPTASGTATPFERCYPALAYRHLDMVREYNRRAFDNQAHHQILQDLAGDARFQPLLPPQVVDAAYVDLDTLHNARRQVCTRFDEVRADSRLRYALVARLAAESPRILDFACGVGYGSYLLSSLPGARVTAIDGAPATIAFARHHWASPAIGYEAASAADWQGAREAYDLVVSFETIEQLPNPERFVERLWATLAPGGILSVSSFNRAHVELGSNPYHVRHFSPVELSGLVSGLAGAAWVRVLGQQHDGPIGRNTETCTVIALAIKQGLGAADTIARVEGALQTLLPLTTVPDVTEPAPVLSGVGLPGAAS